MSKRTAEECLKGEKTDLGDPGQSKRIRATVNLRKDVEQQHQVVDMLKFLSRYFY